jgi:acyl carrier protein
MAAHVAMPRAGVERANEIRQVLRPFLPLAWRERELPDRTPLGAGGLGLDSVRLLEMTLECEVHFGIRVELEELRGPNPSLGDLITLIQQAMSSGGGA